MKKITWLLMVFAVTALLFSCGKEAGPQEKSSSFLMDSDDTVKSAWMDIVADDTDRVREEIYAELGRFDAAVISENWSDTRDIKSSGFLTIEIPSSRFLEMVNWLKETQNVTSLNLNARKQNRYDETDGTVREGVVYSYIQISVTRKTSFADSFRLGLSYAGDAFRFSLEAFVPVVVFLSPFALLVVVIMILVKLGKRLMKRKTGTKSENQTDGKKPGD